MGNSALKCFQANVVKGWPASLNLGILMTSSYLPGVHPELVPEEKKIYKLSPVLLRLQGRGGSVSVYPRHRQGWKPLLLLGDSNIFSF